MSSSAEHQVSELTQRLFNEREYEQALVEIDRELAADPSSTQLWEMKITSLQALGRLPELLDGCEQIIESSPPFAAVHLLKAGVLEMLERDEEALESYEKADELEPSNAETLSTQARLMQRLGRIDGALKVYDRLEQLDPKNHEYMVGKGDVLLGDGRLEEAFAAFQQAADAAPDSFGAVDWDTRGDTLYERGNGEMALRFYEKAIAADSTYAWAYRGRSRVLNKLLNEPTRALADLDKAIELDSQNAWFCIDRGNISFDRKDYESAAQSYRKAAEIDPKYVDAWTNLALAQELLEKYEEAVQSTQKAIELNPQSVDAWGQQGTCLCYLKKLEEAKTCFLKVLELEPGNAVVNGNMGWVLSQLGKDEEALEYDRKHIELSPSEPLGWVNEAESLVKLGRCNEALERLEKSLEIVIDAHDVYAKEASIYADYLFQHEKALECYQECLKRQPDNADVSCGIGECLIIVGRYAEGRAKLESVANRVAAGVTRALSLVVLGSYALEQDSTGQARQFDVVLKQLADAGEKSETDTEKFWNFDGLANKIRISSIPAESKFLVLTAVDMHEGHVKESSLSFFKPVKTEQPVAC